MQTVTAEPWFQVSKGEMVLEGPSFERDGNLLVSDVSEGKVLPISEQKQLTTVFAQSGLGPGGLAIHRDGRIFLAGGGDLKGAGSVVAVNADGSYPQTIVPVSAGFLPNDLVFDSSGGFYFSDFRGSATDLSGGVYYVSPDFKTITPVLQHIAEANGIALRPDEIQQRCSRKCPDRPCACITADRRLHYRGEPALSGIQLRRMPLQRILSNLIGDAIKHHDRPEGHIEVTMDERGELYDFAVRDDGPGIPQQFHEQIFKMFQTLRPRDQVEGSEMGLTKARKTVESFGGDMWVESAEGQGATFRFTWPKDQRSAREANADEVLHHR